MIEWKCKQHIALHVENLFIERVIVMIDLGICTGIFAGGAVIRYMRYVDEDQNGKSPPNDFTN